MELSLDEKFYDRKYPGAFNYKGLALECAFYCVGSVAMSYKVYIKMKADKNPIVSSMIGLACLWMLNIKTAIIVDLELHSRKYPELYEGEFKEYVPNKTRTEVMGTAHKYGFGEFPKDKQE